MTSSYMLLAHPKSVFRGDTRLRDQVIWRLYCSGASLVFVQERFPELSCSAIVVILLAEHWAIGIRHWYLLKPCCWCGDATTLDWGARLVAGGGWECFGCGLARWLGQPLPVFIECDVALWQ